MIGTGPKSGIADREEILAVRKRLREEGKTVVFTNGCFDVLHAGHIELLEFAAEQGDVLVVGVNSDRSVRALKGSGRPVVPQADRAMLLAALEVVDYVTVFDEVHVDRLIGALLPDVLVKGEDRKDWVCGREIVEGHGGRVVLAPLVEGRSTTELVRRIQRMAGHGAAGEATKGTDG
jgi:D-beta-D-heptose 7-phosphate kinase/D-beta-D-heptose 1-phosphate adenosyltransferase